MLILAVDTSGKSLSLALREDERLLGDMTLNNGYTHSQTFMPLLQDLLRTTEKSLSNLDLLAAVSGPGSYTGIRIGLAAMKSLAWARNLPLFSASSLEVLAWPLRKSEAWILPTIDARGGRVFASLYLGGEEKWQPRLPEMNIEADELGRKMAELRGAMAGQSAWPLFLLGDGSLILTNSGSEEFSRASVMDGQATALRASNLAEMAWQRCRDGIPAEWRWENAEANYVSLSQAERLREETRSQR